MLACIKRLFGISAVSLHAALGSVEKALNHLDKVACVKQAEAAARAETIAKATAAKDAATAEMERAALVHGSITQLIV